MSITPIETHYKGYRFRSRPEARWAVFFDALGVPYEYEMEGYDLGEAGWYLPDFWLPRQGAIVEVKPLSLGDHGRPVWPDAKKPAALVDVLPASGPYHRVVILCGAPGPTEGGGFPESYMGFLIEDYGDMGYYWCECPHCGGVGLEFDGRAARLPCGCCEGDKTYNLNTPRLRVAYVAARSARFERGKGEKNG